MSILLLTFIHRHLGHNIKALQIENNENFLQIYYYFVSQHAITKKFNLLKNER